jgi:hypothetical protein
MGIERQTARLRLRQWSEADVAELTALFAEPKVWWYPFRRGFTAADRTLPAPPARRVGEARLGALALDAFSSATPGSGCRSSCPR